MSYTLIVIDMQQSFYHANSSILLENISREIRYAIKQKAAIVFLEYRGQGSTLYDLKKLVKNYFMWETSIKNRDCGGQEVLDTIDKAGYNKERLRLCGVNTDCCVRETVVKLGKLLPKSNLVVVADACNGPVRDFSWVCKVKNCVVETNSNSIYQEIFV